MLEGFFLTDFPPFSPVGKSLPGNQQDHALVVLGGLLLTPHLHGLSPTIPKHPSLTLNLNPASGSLHLWRHLPVDLPVSLDRPSLPGFPSGLLCSPVTFPISASHFHLLTDSPLAGCQPNCSIPGPLSPSPPSQTPRPSCCVVYTLYSRSRKNPSPSSAMFFVLFIHIGNYLWRGPNCANFLLSEV